MCKSWDAAAAAAATTAAAAPGSTAGRNGITRPCTAGRLAAQQLPAPPAQGRAAESPQRCSHDAASVLDCRVARLLGGGLCVGVASGDSQQAPVHAPLAAH